MKGFIFTLLLFPGIAQAGQMSSRYPGLVSLFHFNEGSGSVVKDEITEYTYPVTGAGWASSLYGTGFYKPPSYGYFTIPSSHNYWPTISTMNVFMKYPLLWSGSNQDWYEHQSNNSNMRYMGIYVQPANTLTAYGWNGNYVYVLHDYFITPPPGGYIMLTITYDGGTVNKAYINGQLVNTTIASLTYSGFDTAERVFCHSGGTACLGATFEELATWNRVLSAGEISNIWAEHFSGVDYD